MKKCKQVHFVEGKDLQDLEQKLNEALRDGAELGGIDIASLTGAIVVTEYVGDIKKTALDELEDELGRHNCEECPFFVESNDKRKKMARMRQAWQESDENILMLCGLLQRGGIA